MSLLLNGCFKFSFEQVKREHGKFYQKENPKKKNEAEMSTNCRTKPTTLQTTSTNPVELSNISSSPPIVKVSSSPTFYGLHIL